MGKHVEAIKAFEKAIEVAPWAAETVWYKKGISLKAHGNDTEADVAFAKAKELEYKG